MAGKAKNVSFHQFPRDEELARLWNDILKRGKPYTKYSKVCSLHFRPEDYTITSVGKNKGMCTSYFSIQQVVETYLYLPTYTYSIHPGTYYLRANYGGPRGLVQVLKLYDTS